LNISSPLWPLNVNTFFGHFFNHKKDEQAKKIGAKIYKHPSIQKIDNRYHKKINFAFNYKSLIILLMNKLYTSLVFMLLLFACKTQKASSSYISNEGFIFGTVYHTTYESPEGIDLQPEIEKELKLLDLSVSTFNQQSTLSKVNKNETVQLDSFFLTVYNKSIEVSNATDGAFDITVAPLVNAFGFGFKKKESVTQDLIDSILPFVGYKKVRLNNGVITKEDQRTMLDFSAIAKGYAVDVIGNLLARKGCKSYMVEIGGEVVTKGLNREKRAWRLGINQPNDNEPLVPEHLQAIISLSGKAIATSGNYRNFYVENGKKYAHTINPHTGYPVEHNLLSASVIADDCMTADAFATACMVLGVDKTFEMLPRFGNVEIFLIYAENGENKVRFSKGFEKYIETK